MSDKKTTHFGFKEVPWAEKQKYVGDVFRSVANRYDIMNDVMSMGIHRLWKRKAIAISGLRRKHKVLDLASGTGDLALKMSAIVGNQGQVVCSDINAAMLHHGRDRLINAGAIDNIHYSLINAEHIPCADHYFDCVTISFGLRNVTDKDQALREMCRVLKPGGRAIILEFSQPTVPGLDKIYDQYSFKILPLMGKFIAQDEASYRYLAESIRQHPDQTTLQQMAQNAGFSFCDYQNLSGGIVAIHKAIK